VVRRDSFEVVPGSRSTILALMASVIRVGFAVTASGASDGGNAGQPRSRRTLRRENPTGAAGTKQGWQGARGSKPSRGYPNPADGRWRAGNARVNRTSHAGCAIGNESRGGVPLAPVEGLVSCGLASSVQDPVGRRNSMRGALADIKPIRPRRPEGKTAWPALPGTAKRDRATHRRDTGRSHRTLDETASP
jgi:hypothetical protein